MHGPPAAVPAFARWLPNSISVLRILLVPLWVLFAERCARAVEAGDPADAPRIQAVATLLAIGISDLVDGQLARRWRVESRAGATLDAVADKLAQVTVITWLALRENGAFLTVPLWFLLLLIARDLLLGLGLLGLRRRVRGLRVVHRWHGKLASLLLFVLMIWATTGAGARLATGAWIALGAWIAASTAAYVLDGLRQR
jgi:cardiolipin synthase